MSLLTFAQTAQYLQAGYFIASEVNGVKSHHYFSLDGRNVYSAEAIQAFVRENGRAYDSEKDTQAHLPIDLASISDERPIWQLYESVQWTSPFLPFRTTTATPIRHLQTYLAQVAMREQAMREQVMREQAAMQQAVEPEAVPETILEERVEPSVEEHDVD